MEYNTHLTRRDCVPHRLDSSVFLCLFTDCSGPFSSLVRVCVVLFNLDLNESKLEHVLFMVYRIEGGICHKRELASKFFTAPLGGKELWGLESPEGCPQERLISVRVSNSSLSRAA